MSGLVRLTGPGDPQIPLSRSKGPRLGRMGDARAHQRRPALRLAVPVDDSMVYAELNKSGTNAKI